jgi:hypothetical protein
METAVPMTSEQHSVSFESHCGSYTGRDANLFDGPQGLGLVVNRDMETGGDK